MGEMIRAIKAIQACWQEGTKLDFQGEFYRHTLMTPFFSPGPNPFGPPPLFVAALGPRMTETAAAVADGLLIHPFHSGAFVLDHSVPAVERGLATTGRPRQSFTLAATAILATGSSDDEQAGAEAGIRRLLAFYGSTPAYRVVLDAHGWGPLQEDLNRLSKQGRWVEMAEIVPDEVVDALVVRGEPDHIGDVIAKRYGGQLDRISFSTPYPISAATMAAVLASVRATHTPQQ
jgi:probable F420-dependent oxidoreductase